MYSEALFTQAKTRQQLSVLRWVAGERRCGTYIHWKLLSRREDTLPSVTWMELESVMLG